MEEDESLVKYIVKWAFWIFIALFSGIALIKWIWETV